MEIADDKNIGITDFIGVQNYGYPIFKFGFNEGKPLPGMIKNFKFPFLNFGFSVGSTSKKGGIVSSFGPPFSPEAMIDCLLEAKDANCPLLISETGYDANVQHFSKPKFEIDQKVQKKAYEVIFAIIALVRCDNFSHKIILRNHLINLINQPQNIELIRKIDQLCFSKIDLKGCTFWTLFKNFEWENGWGNTRLDIHDVKTNSEGRIASSKMNLTGKYVQQMCLLKKNLTRSDLKELSA